MSRQLPCISSRIDWPTRRGWKTEIETETVGFSSKTEPKLTENEKSKTVTTLVNKILASYTYA